MQKELHLRTKVLPGGKIEIAHVELSVGKTVDVVVRESSDSAGRSAIDILSEAPGQRIFKTAEEAESYVADERTSWKR